MWPFLSRAEKEASLLCELVSMDASNKLPDAKQDLEDYLVMLRDYGLRFLINHLFDGVFERVKISRQCLPKEHSELVKLLAHLRKFLPELPLVEIPGNAGAKLDSTDVLLYMNKSAQLGLDLDLLSNVDALTAVAIATGSLSAASDKVCSHKSVRTAGLYFTKEVQARQANLQPRSHPCPHPSPAPPYQPALPKSSTGSSSKRPSPKTEPNFDDSNKQG